MVVSTRSQKQAAIKRQLTLDSAGTKKQRVATEMPTTNKQAPGDEMKFQHKEPIIDYKPYFDGAKDFILQVLRQRKSSFVDSTGLWNSLSSAWQSDHEVALLALKNNFAKAVDLPHVLQNDTDFLIAAIKENDKVWSNLPFVLRNQPIFAQAIRTFSSKTLAWCVFQEIPTMLDSKEVWMKIINSKLQGVDTLFAENAPTSILSDANLMRKLIEQAPSGMRLVHPTLLQDVGFVDDTLFDYPKALKNLPIGAQQQHASSVADSFEDFFGTCDSVAQRASLADAICPTVMSQRSVTKAWFQAGGPFVLAVFPEAWRRDKEIFLWMAEYGGQDVCTYSFFLADDSLHLDKDFMLKAIELEPTIYVNGTKRNLKSDYDITLMALAKTKCSSAVADLLQAVPSAYLKRFNDRFRERNTTHKAFYALLGGMSHLANEDCALQVLNQGTETSVSYKRLIADYLDLPKKKEVCLLDATATNMIAAAFESELESDTYDSDAYW